jgi:hypothetical protein
MANGGNLLITKSNIPPSCLVIDKGLPPERRKSERVGLPTTAFALEAQGYELERVADINGGGLLLSPASPWARVALVKGQQFVITVVEPSFGRYRTRLAAVPNIASLLCVATVAWLFRFQSREVRS